MGEAKASAAPIVHSRGLGWGPPTLCGEAGPIPEPAGEVTCPRCLDILGDSKLLAARAEEVTRTHGKPPKLIHLDDETVVNPADLPIPYVRIFVEMLEEVGRQVDKGRDDAFDDARSPCAWIDCAKRVLVDAWLGGPSLRHGFVKLGALALKAVASFDRKSPGGAS